MAFPRSGAACPDRWSRVLAHRDRLLNLVRARGVSRDDAEDVVQEALLRAATFEALDEERLGQLLTSVTTRLCVDEHRRRQRASHLWHKLPVDAAQEPAADEDVCARAEAEWAATVVGTLPPIQQVVLAERAEGLSYEEIALRHRLSYKSVESAASRARGTVRRALAATLGVVAFARRPAVAPAMAATAVALTLGVGSSPHVAADAVPAPVHDVDIGRAAVAGARPARDMPPRSAVAPADTDGRSPVDTRTQPRRAPAVPAVEVAGGPRIGYDDRHGEFTTVDRVRHCIEHGVETAPTVRCRYPDEGKSG